MSGGSGSEDPQEMRKVIRQAVQEAMSDGGGPSSPPRRHRVAHGSKSDALSPQQIRQLVAEEIAAQRQQSGAPSSGGTASSGSPSSSASSTGWGMFRHQKSSSGGKSSQGSQSQSSSGQAKTSAGTSTEAVAQVLGQAQWELSEDLSANLKELRRVINQSQEIARKIEQVLGQGTSGQGG